MSQDEPRAMGLYIAIEGAEGVGKTTISQMLVEKLSAENIPSRLVHEPDGKYDATTKEIRRITQDPTYPMNSRTEALLYNAARSQSLDGVIVAKRQGITCISDRSYLTTLAVQFYGRNDIHDYQRLNDIIDFAVHGVWPDLTIVLDAPVEVLKQRAMARGERERFDDLDAAMLERIRAGYLWEAKQRNLPVVYATESATTTFDAVWRHISVALGLRHGSAADPVAVAEVLAKSPAAKVLEAKQRPTLSSSEQTYFTPPSLPDNIQCDYCDDIERILSARRKLAAKLAQHLARDDKKIKASEALTRALDILRPLLPVACDAETLHPILDKAKQLRLDPAILKRLPTGFRSDDEAVRLVAVSPRNELDLVPYLLYESLDLPLQELKTVVSGWPYDVKAQILESYLEACSGDKDKPCSQNMYEFDCLTDVSSLIALTEKTHADPQLQTFTPRYGYTMPPEVETAELCDEYDAIFDLSLRLQSTLQAQGYPAESQYATLLGHRQRWTCQLTVEQIAAVKTIPACAPFVRVVALAHPLVAQTLRFTNDTSS